VKISRCLYSTTQSVQAIIEDGYLEKMLDYFLLLWCTIDPKYCFKNVLRPHVAKRFIKMVSKFHPSTQNENVNQLSTFSHISICSESHSFSNQMCVRNGTALHYQLRNTCIHSVKAINSTKSLINRALFK